MVMPPLLHDTGAQTSSNSLTTLTNVESLTNLNGIRVGQCHNHLDVVTWHDHLTLSILRTFRESQVDRLVRCSEVELGAVVLVETSVAATLFLGKNIEGGEELSVRLDRARLADNHAAADILPADTTDEETRVVTSLRLVARLLESFNIRNLGLDNLLALANELDFLITLQDTTLNTSRDNSTTARDREDILNRHEERLVQATLGSRDPLVNSGHELVNLVVANLRFLVVQSAKSRAHDDRGLVTLEAISAEKLAHFHLNEFQHLGVINGIDLVDKHDNLLDANLSGKEQVFTGLGHLSVGGGDNNNSTIHVGSASNHVLDIIGVARAVDVGIVTVLSSVLDMRGRNGNTTLALLRSLVNGAILEKVGKALLGLSLGDGSRKGGLK